MTTNREASFDEVSSTGEVAADALLGLIDASAPPETGAFTVDSPAAIEHGAVAAQPEWASLVAQTDQAAMLRYLVGLQHMRSVATAVPIALRGENLEGRWTSPVLARAGLQALALSWHLTDPTTPLQQRIERFLEFQYYSAVEERRAVSENDWARVEARAEAVKDLAERLELAVPTGKVQYTEIVKDYLDNEPITRIAWRYCSGVEHSVDYALQRDVLMDPSGIRIMVSPYLSGIALRAGGCGLHRATDTIFHRYGWPRDTVATAADHYHQAEATFELAINELQQ